MSRVGRHIYDARWGRDHDAVTPKDAWVLELLDDGLHPVLEIVEEVHDLLVNPWERERQWIRDFTMAADLLNVAGLPAS